MNAEEFVLNENGHRCQCGLCRPDLNLVAVDFDVGQAEESARAQETDRLPARDIRSLAALAQ